MSHTLHAPRAISQRRTQRTKRLLALEAVAESLLSVAGLTGAPVVHRSGAEVGQLVDIVVRWEGEPYPPLTGLVVRVGRRLAWVPADKVDELEQRQVVLRSAKLDLRDFSRRDNEVKLVDDVIDHQMVDVDGVRVFRAADLFLAKVGGGYRLVGADVGFATLLRRLGPARWRARPHPDRVIDWAAIQPFGAGNGRVPLRRTNQELARLHPSQLADLLEELGRTERQELLEVLEPESAADALEEMEPEKLDKLLRELPASRAASLVADMEPDEAVDALRLLTAEDRDEVLGAMAPAASAALRRLLRFPALTAGGLMTTRVVTVRPGETVATVRERLRAAHEHRADIDCVVIVDDDGRLVDDITMFELFTADLDTSVSALAAPPWPFTVAVDTDLPELVDRVIRTRGTSVIVVDEAGRPVGRILVDDVIDALVPDGGQARSRRHG